MLFQINAITSDEIVNKLHETFGLEKETQQWLNIVFNDDDITPDKLPPLPRNVLNLQV